MKKMNSSYVSRYKNTGYIDIVKRKLKADKAEEKREAERKRKAQEAIKKSQQEKIDKLKNYVHTGCNNNAGKPYYLIEDILDLNPANVKRLEGGYNEKGGRLFERYVGKFQCVKSIILPRVAYSILMSDYHGITKIPSGIGNLKYLKKFILTKCAIKSIPPEIQNCKSLEYLNFSGCVHLSSIPDLSGLNNLKELLLADTELAHRLKMLLNRRLKNLPKSYLRVWKDYQL